MRNKKEKVGELLGEKQEIVETISLPNRALLRISEVAEYFDVTERTVRLWIEHGHLKAEGTPGGQLRITKESVDRCRFRDRVRAD